MGSASGPRVPVLHVEALFVLPRLRHPQLTKICYGRTEGVTHCNSIIEYCAANDLENPDRTVSAVLVMRKIFFSVISTSARAAHFTMPVV